MNEPQKIPVKWSVPKVWSVPDEYTVPFPYSIPEEYSIPLILEEVPTSSTQTTSSAQTRSNVTITKRFEIDALTAALITAGMIGLFGGVMIGRITKENKEVEKQ